MNAFTAHELTTYYVRVPDDRLGLALEILSDIVWDPAFRPDEVDSERQVILEEIRMRDDAPEDQVHELFGNAIFPEHPDRPRRHRHPRDDHRDGAGRDRRVPRRALPPEQRRGRGSRQPEHDEVVALVEAGLVRYRRSAPGNACRGTAVRRRGPLAVLERDTEQAHVVLGMRAIGRDDPDRYALTVLNQVLGGGMSSRLFQEVREKRGTRVLGVLVTAARTRRPDRSPSPRAPHPSGSTSCSRRSSAELARITTERGVTERELAAAKGHLTGSLALSLESSSSRMHRLGRSELTLGEIPSLDELVEEVGKVEAGDVTRVVDRVLGGPDRSLAVVGPVDAAKLARPAS